MSPAGDLVQPPSSSVCPPSPPSEESPKPSKRLIILAECKWAGEADRNQVLKELCERMAWDQLDEPFWIKKYLISPMGQTVEGTGTSSNRCIQYKIHISMPKLEPEKPVKPVRPEKPVKVRPVKPVTPAQPGRRRGRKQLQVGKIANQLISASCEYFLVSLNTLSCGQNKTFGDIILGFGRH